MNNTTKIKIFLVDDDALLLKSLEIQFKELGNFDVTTFETGEQCINHLSESPDVIILDYHLDGVNPTVMNGLATLDKIKMFNENITVIMLSSQDKIEVAINCMHHKATDYVVKSETAFIRLQKIIEDNMEYKQTKNNLNWYMGKM